MTDTGQSLEFRFAGFNFDPTRAALRHDGAAETAAQFLGSRAAALLGVLLENAGRLVTKDQIFASVWPGTAVEEANLSVQISALRRALDRYRGDASMIQTVTGRGYRLIVPVERRSDRGASAKQRPRLSPPDRPAIAVLPFANLTGDPGQGCFADGMVEEIITALSRIRWLVVAARDPSFSGSGETGDAERVGRDLGVEYLLEGSVRRAEQRLRISARLIDAISAAHIWSDRFEGTLDNPFELQDRVASSIAGVIEPILQAEEIRRSASRSISETTAYDCYLRALALAFSWERDRVFHALDLFEQAIAQEPHFGPALAEAAFCHFQIDLNGWSDNAVDTRRLGIARARRALEVAGDNPNVLCLAAYTLAYFGEDLDAAIALIQRGLDLNPNHARAWQWAGWLWSWAGEPDVAIRHFQTSLRLNPREQRSNPLLGIGVAHFFARRFEDSRTILRQSLLEKPAWAPTYRFLAACCSHLGRLDEARDAVAQLRDLTTAVMPNAAHWRRPQDRELLTAGIRLALGETEPAPHS